MAKAAQKRRASSNARAVQTLVYGFLLTNTLYITAQLVRYRSIRWPVGVWAPYLLTETIAALLALQLMSMARSGEDLSQPGLTAYMLDMIPIYALYLLYTYILAPYVFKRHRAPTQAPSAAPATEAQGPSKRQAKRQVRARPGRRA
ncbi:hypothetical protein MNAN1_003227 [Malassezia nana]|uniref:Uncharacterized protein n=1 Tax=Malassezia nana TaxID=180528 RepID=A0AAF0J3J2_9BASI|nr:hypothetical protein MNAN1_003227 [Malassezia nana]